MIGVGQGGPIGDASGDARSPEPAERTTGARRAAVVQEERDAWAVLAGVDGLGPLTFTTLLRRFGDARSVLDLASRVGGAPALVAASGERDPGDGPPGPAMTLELAATVVAASVEAPATLERIHALGLRVVTLDDPDYPTRLAAIDLPPMVLFVRGDVASMEPDHAVAVVGTRRATNHGRALAARIAGAVAAAGASVVSGLAVGIDGAAHAATLDAGGRTVAVIGAGHARLFPRAHLRLAAAIEDAGGAVVSELGPDVGPRAWTFPRRNRLVSGLADATVVVEAPARSGALLTASWCLEQGRECFLVPGAVDAPMSAGCLAFLRDFPGSARIVSGVPQLIEDLGLVTRPSGRRTTTLTGATLTELGGTAAEVGRGLVDGLATVDELVAVTGLPVATVLAALTLLEARGLAAGAFGRYRPAGTLAFVEPRRRQRPRRCAEATA